ncbi:SidA/IucD/PvdA family monooxygenase [Micromonospora sp. KC606]|uniref:lysine N(6)-hydroxylase/L-ornithine N(5)-oxygenase family protein n=1 Tax=Micromonospora sp. KC606 TaxID=2530379 RepID=UPI001FB805C3|nr:SidA/IucD/PvdA family monooxygenase [Micromonospora sp. KC606]
MIVDEGLIEQRGYLRDLIGIGFGPSNLALAVAVAEHEHEHALAAAFLESKPAFRWHEGMLIDGATMQVSFLKDLVTLRDPSSAYSFLSYLHEKGRLIDFINHKELYPSRTEFHDYFAWAAARLEHLVTYECAVTHIEPVWAGDRIAHFAVHTRRSPDRPLPARNLVLATGLRPRMPDGVQPGPRVWHNHELLYRTGPLHDTAPRRLVVVGAGQSAAETAEYLHRTFGTAEINLVFARYGFSPADDSPFANRIFDPAAVDDFFAADDETKQRLLKYHANTNYSVVDLELIDELYRRHYQERVNGHERLRFLKASRIASLDERDDTVVVRVAHQLDGTISTIEADAVVFATGYRPPDHTPLLGGVADLVVRDTAGRPVVDRDYRLRLRVPATGGIYLQGGTEHTHGITASLLSNSAVRAGEILASITASARFGELRTMSLSNTGGGHA